MVSSAQWDFPGARWWKVDFHTHTPASKCTFWHNLIGTENELTPEKWLLNYMSAGIDCVAITDHNSGSWIDKLKDAYAKLERERPEGFRELHLFPGIEISVQGGLHLLAIFDKDTTTSDIDSILGQVEYDGTKGDSDGVTRKSPIEVLEIIVKNNGIPIPAHVDQEKGLFQALHDANTLRQLLKFQNVLAAEVIDRTLPKPQIYSELGVRWTEILGSDCHNFRGEKAPGSRYTWVRMATPSLEGLRIALFDGEGFSIRRSDDQDFFDPFSLPEHFIESIEISKARYMGRDNPEVLRFSPWFNALVGGRGTGKSTIVNFMRIGLQREKELEKLVEEEEARRAFERFNRVGKLRSEKGGLLDETETFITFVRDGVRYRLRWRKDGHELIVEEEVNGVWKLSSSQSVTPDRFPVRIFSQGQMVALAGESQEALLAIIDEAAKIQHLKKEFDEACQDFYALRAQIRKLDGKLASKEQLNVRLEDVQRKLLRFEQSQHSEVLREYQFRTKQELELERRFKNVENMAASIEQIAKELVWEELPKELFDSTLAENHETTRFEKRLKSAIQAAALRLAETAKDLKQVLKEEQMFLKTGSDWSNFVRRAKNDYETLVKKLREHNIDDPAEYDKLVQEQSVLNDELAQLNNISKKREELINKMKEIYRRIINSRRKISQKRREFLLDNLADNSYVRITLLPYGRDPRSIERSLREMLGVVDGRFADDILVMDQDEPRQGIVAYLLNELPDNVQDAERELEERIRFIKSRFEKACKGNGDFGGYFNNFLMREYNKTPEFFDRLLTWFPEDSLLLEYSVKGDGRDFRPIGQASPGQRAAAMLAFLLAHGTEPIILDQPEDDLDNHLIYDLVVRQIRENKLRRQLIIVTHNPNIVVNGDAEMIHALDFRKGQCRVVQNGSLQEKAVREEICRIMEGGREAFERRWRRIGQEVSYMT